MNLPGTRIEANGLSFHVVDEGEGTPIVLLHGFPDSSFVWRHQIPGLADAGFRVIAPDTRGRGQSDRPDAVEDYLVTALAADVTAIMDALGIERAHIVGHDSGAATAWFVATLAPDRVDHLVALSVGRPGTYRRTIRDLRRGWYMFMFQLDEAEDFLTRNGWENFRNWSATAPDTEQYVQILSEPGALRAGLNYYRANVSPAVLLGEPFELPKIASPTLGVWSTLDFALTEEQMTASEAEVAAEWRYERLEGIGHWIPTEAPEHLTELLVEFLPTAEPASRRP